MSDGLEPRRQEMLVEERAVEKKDSIEVRCVQTVSLKLSLYSGFD